MYKACAHVLSFVNSRAQKEFRIGPDCDSINKKVILVLDNGVDMNVLNRKIFRTLFPDLECQPSNVILENFENPMSDQWGHSRVF